jgi:hypothetical protein
MIGRKSGFSFAASLRAPNQGFALALTVDVRGVEEVDAGVTRGAQEVDEAPAALLKDPADAGASESELRNLEIRAAETAPLHRTEYPRSPCPDDSVWWLPA